MCFPCRHEIDLCYFVLEIPWDACDLDIIDLTLNVESTAENHTHTQNGCTLVLFTQFSDVRCCFFDAANPI